MSPSRILCVALIASSAVACVVDGDGPSRSSTPPSPYKDNTGDPSPAPATPPASGTAPMLVEVDTDQTMSADPGQGVGVFIEYVKGGIWNVWWTCDTAKTQKTCDFNVSMSVAAGKISDVDSSQLEGLTALPTPTRLDASSTTSTQVSGVSFKTNPGAVLTVSASVSGLKDGSFLFFVQNGKVNGGFAGPLTNPLQLQGNIP